MSTAVVYDPTLFALERAEVVSARLGELILGESHLGSDTSAWVDIPAATFSLTEGYTVDEFGTLIYDSETASVSLSFWDEPGDLLQPGDRVRASYDSHAIFLGTVDTTDLAFDTVNGRLRFTFTAGLVGSYAALMSAVVCWTTLPAETPITRIRRWLRVVGW
jgi:hypothetical protein